MMKVIEALLGAGKTFQGIKRSVMNLIKGLTTVFLVPSHAIGAEVIDGIKKNGVPSNCVAVSLYGKRDGTCMPDHLGTPCKRCPISKDIYKWGEDRVDEVLDAVRGRAFTLDELQELARRFNVCVVMLSRLIATTKKIPRIVVAPHQYLATLAGLKILEAIAADQKIIDEADTIPDMLRGEHQHQMTLAQARNTKASTHRTLCNQNCDGCTLHVADRASSGAISPMGGRVDSLDGISNPANLMELLEPAINLIEKGVQDGVIQSFFQFENIRSVVTRIMKLLGTPKVNESAWDALTRIEKADESIALSFRADPINAIPIVVEPVITEEAFDESDELTEAHMRIAALKSRVYIADTPHPEVVKKYDVALQVFLSLIDFLAHAPGYFYAVPEKRGSSKGGAEYCRLTLRYLNTKQYGRVREFLSENSILMSGTLLTQRMVEASLLMPPGSIDFRCSESKMHSSVLILLHNHQQQSVMPRLTHFCLDEAKALYETTQNHVADIQILHFAKNTTASKEMFKLLNDDPRYLARFRVEERERNSARQDLYSSYENAHRERPAITVIDKLRSSTSRGVNRGGFNFCTVIGNGIANFSTQITLYLEARKLDPTLTLDELIGYEQVRAVVQALMRAPRTAEHTVCFYSGNLHVPAFPAFLRNRILTTHDILASRELAAPEKAETQIEALAWAVSSFIKGEPITLQRQQTANPFADLIPLWEGRKDAIEGRLSHIDQCLKEKGYIDRVADKKGKRPDWSSFLEWLVGKGVLIQSERGGKKVLIKNVSP